MDSGNARPLYDGDAYEENHGRWSRAVGRMFVNWLALPRGLRWLDVGCGTGAASAMILAEGNPAAIVGIDPSESQISYAARHTDDRRAQFQVGDAQSLAFGDDEFDVAVSALVLNLVPDSGKAVAEMRRVVRSSGTVASYIWDLSVDGHPTCPLVNGFARFNPNAPGFGGGGSRRIETREDVTRLFEEAGLANLVTQKFEIPVRYASFEEYWAITLLSQGPPGAYLRSLSAGDVAKLRDLLRETLPTSGGGEIVYPACAWGIQGTVP